MEPKPNIKGVRIRILNQIMLAFSVALFIVVLYTTVRVSRDYTESLTAIENYINWEKAAYGMHAGSDALTKHAQLYAQTCQPEHARNYFDELYNRRTRENAFNFVVNSPDVPHNKTLSKSLEFSNALTHREIYAIRLVAEATGEDPRSIDSSVVNTKLTAKDRAKNPQEKIERARELMFDAEYQKAKQKIIDPLVTILNQNLETARERQRQSIKDLGQVISEQRIVLIALCALNVLTFAMIIVLIIKPLQIYLKCIKDDKMFELVGAYEFKHLALTYNDIFALKEHHDKMLKHKAEHDPLTGLLNRAAFDSLCELFANDCSKIGLIILDVDKFKEINDTYGHQIGDKVLCRVAWLLLHSFRSDDFCIRLGGDEFVVILHGFEADMTNVIREKIYFINDALQHPKDDLPKTSLSVGVAFSNCGYSKELFNHADAALYEVKKSGRHSCRFYEAGDEKPEDAGHGPENKQN